ncbi:hypothetical protein NliqN6_2776 [Naganishia liquefaciens]|uniref:ER transporter 6TM N-terminal domain-containing protein n=1 Tax=Naganishia liquefaciens TaxID=104408 RepID=A0A8H3TUG0_9TREE|nr:hypothetical protein NliqN6_2776 [Naganishia liquefaciens]
MSEHHGDGTSSSGTATEKSPSGTQDAAKKRRFATRLDALLAKLPKWLATPLKEPRKWKTFTRCMIVLFANLVLLVCQSSLESAGQAAFFGLIVACILPPYLPLSVFLFMMLTIIVGMCIGWAWGIAAMAAALQARDRTLLASQYTRAQNGVVAGTNPDAQFQRFVFEGYFLDTRSTIVFAIFFFVGTYFLGSIRALAPKLTLLCLFGTIVMDVMMSYGPLFPSQQYTLATQFLIPTGYYVATAVASIILIFPQTLSHALTSGYIAGVLKAGNGLVGLQAKVLETSPENLDAWSALSAKARELRQISSGALVQITGSLGMLELEVSYGRVSARDLKLLVEKSKVLVGRLMGVASFQLLVEEAKRNDRRDASDSAEGFENKNVDRLFKLRHVMNEKEQGGGRGIVQLLPILKQSSERLRTACTSGLAGSTDWLEWTNTHRWSRGNKAYPPGESVEEGLMKRKAAIEELKDALEEFRTAEHIKLLEPFRELFDEETGDFLEHPPNMSDKDAFRLRTRSLFISFVFVTNLISYATTLIDFLQALLEIEARSPKNKLQWPTALRKIFKVAMSHNGTNSNPLEIGTQDVDDETDSSDDEDSESTSSTLQDKRRQAKEQRRRKTEERRRKKYVVDPDAELPRNGLQRFLRTIGLAWRWQSSPQGLFALKYSLVSIALWVPAVVPNSAYFNYVNRGLWALIMAQTGLGVFAGEQIVNFLARMAGTLIGLVLGMLAWYMGSGHGRGNAYGTVAATLVVTAPFLFARIVAPQPVMALPLMIAVTIVFVIGYSWLDTHLPVLANQGYGVDVAWRRALLVIIGFTAGFIISLFPKPQSAKVTVRKSIAKTVDRLAELYTEEIKGFILEANLYTEGMQQTLNIEERATRYRTRFLGLVGKIQAIQPQMTNARFEPALRGPWPREKYESLMHRIQELLGAMALLSNSWTRMRSGWAKFLVEDTPFFEPNFIADSLGLLSLITHSLRDGQQMPASLPLVERLAGLSLQRHHHAETNDSISSYRRGNMLVRDTVLDVPVGKDKTGHAGRLNWRMLQDEQLAIYATASIALSHIALKTDQIHQIVRQLVGEQQFDVLGDLSKERARKDAEWLDRA